MRRVNKSIHFYIKLLVVFMMIFEYVPQIEIFAANTFELTLLGEQAENKRLNFEEGTDIAVKDIFPTEWGTSKDGLQCVIGFSDGTTTYNVAQDANVSFRMPGNDLTMQAIYGDQCATFYYADDQKSEVAIGFETFGTRVVALSNDHHGFTKEGFVFKGWTNSTTSQDVVNDYVANQTHVFYAMWTPQVPITINDEGQTTMLYVDFNITRGELFEKVSQAPPTKEGYEFVGWQLESGDWLRKEDSTVISEALTLEIIYTQIMTINVYEDGNVKDSVSIAYGSTYQEALDKLKAQGYTKEGFYIKDYQVQGTSMYDALETKIESDLDVMIIWGENPRITYQDGSTLLEQQTYPYQTTITDFLKITKPGVAFRGWSLSADSKSAIKELTIMSDITLYAIFEEVVYITLDQQNGEGSLTFEVAYGSTIGAFLSDAVIQIPVRENNRFLGWSLTPNGTVLETIDATVMDQDITLYAQWQPQIIITIDDQNDTLLQTLIKDQGILLGDVVGSLVQPSKTGFSFLGYAQAQNGPLITKEDDQKVENNLTLYAQWKENPKLTFDSNEGQGQYSTQSYPLGSKVSNLPGGASLQKTGFIFRGWSTTSDGMTPVSDVVMDQDITLYAIWDDQAQVTLKQQNGEPLQTYELQVGTTYGEWLQTLTPPKRAGYTFMWYSFDAQGEAIDEAQSITSDAVLYANWQQQPTLSYVVKGEIIQRQKVDYDTVITDFLKISEPGNIFRGWAMSENSTIAITELTLQADTTLYAILDDEATVTIHAFFSPTIIEQKIALSPAMRVVDAIAKLEVPSYEGYTFQGYAYEPMGAIITQDDPTLITQDLDLYEVWLKNQTLTFDSNGGQGQYSTQSYPWGSKVSNLPGGKSLQKTGFIFRGWSTTRDGMTPVSEVVMDQDITLYAIWDDQAQVTLKQQNGESLQTYKLQVGTTYGEWLQTLTPPKKAGYTFMWYSFDAQGEAIDEAQSITSDVMVYANWQQQPTLSYVVKGEIIHSQKVDYDTVITDFLKINEPGNIFRGWAISEGSTMVIPQLHLQVDTTLYAILDDQAKIVIEGSTYTAEVGSLLADFVKTLEAPQQEDARFVGWATSAQGDWIQNDSKEIITEDLTLYAIWQPQIQVLVEETAYLFDEGTTLGDIVSHLQAPMKTGFTFLGFALEDQGTILSKNDPTIINEAVTLYPIWHEDIRVTLMVNDLVVQQLQFPYRTILYQKDLPSGQPYVDYGYYFSGWGNPVDVLDSLELVSDLTLYLQSSNESKAIIDDQNESTPKTSTAPYLGKLGVYVQQLPPPVYDHHTFLGYAVTPDGDVISSDDTSQIDQNLTLYAKWMKNPILHFDSQGGPIVEDIEYPYLTMVNRFPQISQDGMIFRGWSTVPDGKIPVESLSVTSDITLYAIFDNQATITIDDQNGDDQFDQRVEVGTSMQSFLEAFTPPVRKGFSFLGYSFTLDGDIISPSDPSLITQDVILYATWIKNPIIHFDSQGGSVVEDIEYPYNTTVTTFPQTSQIGLIFRGWSTSSDGKIPVESLDVTSELTLYAIFDNQAIITIDQQNGEELFHQRFDVGTSMQSVLESLTPPVRDGYTFLGYAFTSNGDIISPSDPTLIDQDLTLFAIWKKNPILRFDSQGGPTVEDIEYPYLTMVNRFPQISQNGMIFRGWSTSKDGKIPLKNLSMTSDITLYAIWDAHAILTIDWQQPFVDEKLQVNVNTSYQEAFTQINIPQVVHYTFIGYALTPEGDIISSDDSSLIDQDLTLYAKWMKNPIIHFDSQGGAVVEDIEYPYNTTVTTFPQTSQNGLIFRGWSTSSDGKIPLESLNVTSDITLYAIFDDQATITIDQQNGDELFHQRFDVGTSIQRVLETLSIPTREGSTFLGYAFTLDGDIISSSDPTLIDQDLTLYAKWIKNPKVSYDANGGIGHSEAQVFDYRTILQQKDLVDGSQFVRPGYIFRGWTTLANATSPFDSFQILEDTTLYAVWDDHAHVLMDDQNGSDVRTQTIVVGTTLGSVIAMESIPSKEGFVFKGYSLAQDGPIISIDDPRPITSDLHLYAIYDEAITLRIYYDNGMSDGVLVMGKHDSLGEVVAKLNQNQPTKTHYTFKGWEVDGQVIDTNTTTLVGEHRDVVATWYKNPLLFFDVQGADGRIDAQEYSYPGEATTLPNGSNLEKEGYIFRGWSVSATQPQAIASLTFYVDTILYAIWDDHAKVWIDDQNGTTVNEQDMLVGTSLGAVVSALHQPSKEGYYFKGYALEPQGEVITFNDPRQLRQDVTLYAIWVPERTITLHYQDGSTPNQTFIVAQGDTLGSVVQKINEQSYVYEGYTWLGVSLTPSGTLLETSDERVVTQNLDVYLRWQGQYTLHFDTNGGITTVDDLYFSGHETPFNLQNIHVEKPGYIFYGWSRDQSEANLLTSIQVSEDTTLYAIYRKDNRSNFKTPQISVVGGANLSAPYVFKENTTYMMDITYFIESSTHVRIDPGSIHSIILPSNFIYVNSDYTSGDVVESVTSIKQNANNPQQVDITFNTDLETAIQGRVFIIFKVQTSIPTKNDNPISLSVFLDRGSYLTMDQSVIISSSNKPVPSSSKFEKKVAKAGTSPIFYNEQGSSTFFYSFLKSKVGNNDFEFVDQLHYNPTQDDYAFNIVLTSIDSELKNYSIVDKFSNTQKPDHVGFKACRDGTEPWVTLDTWDHNGIYIPGTSRSLSDHNATYGTQLTASIVDDATLVIQPITIQKNAVLTIQVKACYDEEALIAQANASLLKVYEMYPYYITPPALDVWNEAYLFNQPQNINDITSIDNKVHNSLNVHPSSAFNADGWDYEDAWLTNTFTYTCEPCINPSGGLNNSLDGFSASKNTIKVEGQIQEAQDGAKWITPLLRNGDGTYQSFDVKYEMLVNPHGKIVPQQNLIVQDVITPYNFTSGNDFYDPNLIVKELVVSSSLPYTSTPSWQTLSLNDQSALFVRNPSIDNTEEDLKAFIQDYPNSYVIYNNYIYFNFGKDQRAYKLDITYTYQNPSMHQNGSDYWDQYVIKNTIRDEYGQLFEGLDQRLSYSTTAYAYQQAREVIHYRDILKIDLNTSDQSGYVFFKGLVQETIFPYHVTINNTHLEDLTKAFVTIDLDDHLLMTSELLRDAVNGIRIQQNGVNVSNPLQYSYYDEARNQLYFNLQSLVKVGNEHDRFDLYFSTYLNHDTLVRGGNVEINTAATMDVSAKVIPYTDENISTLSNNAAAINGYKQVYDGTKFSSKAILNSGSANTSVIYKLHYNIFQNWNNGTMMELVDQLDANYQFVGFCTTSACTSTVGTNQTLLNKINASYNASTHQITVRQVNAYIDGDTFDFYYKVALKNTVQPGTIINNRLVTNTQVKVPYQSIEISLKDQISKQGISLQEPVSFDLYQVDQLTKVGSIPLDEQGVGVLKGSFMPNSMYYLKQNGIPTNAYQPNPDWILLDLDQASKTACVTTTDLCGVHLDVWNTKYNSTLRYQVLQNGSYIKNKQIKLYQADQKTLMTTLLSDLTAQDYTIYPGTYYYQLVNEYGVGEPLIEIQVGDSQIGQVTIEPLTIDNKIGSIQMQLFDQKGWLSTQYPGTYEIIDENQQSYSFTVNQLKTLANIPYGTYQIKEVATPFGYDALPTCEITVGLNALSPTCKWVYSETKFAFTVENQGNFKVKQPIEGSRFTMYPQGQPQQSITYTSDHNGQFTSDAFTPGTYVLTQIEVPIGYELQTSQQLLLIEHGVQPQVMTIMNEPTKQNIMIHVEHEMPQTSKANLLFQVYQGSTLVGGGYSDENGFVEITGLVVDDYVNGTTYQVKEVVPPLGYPALAPQNVTVYFNNRGNTSIPTLSFFNVAYRHSIQVQLQDTSLNKNAVCDQNVRLELQGDSLMVATSDPQGKATFNNLLPGHYTLTQQLAAGCLGTPSQSIDIVVDNTTKAYPIHFTNHQVTGTAMVEVKDATTQEFLANVGFLLYVQVQGTQQKVSDTVYVSDAYGKVVVNGLDPGDYFFDQQPVVGYVTSPTRIETTVEFNQNTTTSSLWKQSVMLEEKKHEIQVNITNLNSDGDMRCVNDVYVWVEGPTPQSGTTKNGTIVFQGLLPGTYKVQQRPPAGCHATSVSQQNLTVARDDRDSPYPLHFDNQTTTGFIELTTIDQDTQKVMSGVTYQLYHNNTLYSDTIYVSDIYGNLKVEGLYPGTYTFQPYQRVQGYEQDPNTYAMTVEFNQSAQCSSCKATAYVVEKKVPFIVSIHDSTQNMNMPNMTFSLYQATYNQGEYQIAEKIGDYSTGALAQVTTQALKPGVYYLSNFDTISGLEVTKEIQVEIPVGSEHGIVVNIESPEYLGKVELSITNIDRQQMMEQIRVQVYEFIDGAYVEVNKAFSYQSNGQGKVVLYALQPNTTYYVKQNLPLGYEVATGQNQEGYLEVFVPESGVGSVEVHNQELRKHMTMNTIDWNTNIPLDGVVFNVYDVRDSQTILYTCTTSNGTCDVQDEQGKPLLSGDYRMQVQVPTGYQTISDFTYQFIVGDTTPMVYNLAVKEKTGNLHITVVDFDRPTVTMKDALIDVYTQGEYLKTIVNEAGSSSIDVSGLYPGTYVLKPRKLYGYAAMEDVSIVIPFNPTVIDTTLYYYELRKAVRINLLDETLQRPITNIKVQTANYQCTTDTQGSCQLKDELNQDVLAGTYEVEERLPIGYQNQAPTTFDFALGEVQPLDLVIHHKQILGSLTMQLEDLDQPGLDLSKAKIRVKDEQDQYLNQGNTYLIQNNQIVLNQIIPGTYQLEVESPKGYETFTSDHIRFNGNQQEFSFEIATLNNGYAYTLGMDFIESEIALTFMKYDANTNLPLSNVTFTLGNETLVSDEKGQFVAMRKPGTYTLEETLPIGYKDAIIQDITLEVGDEPRLISLSNNPIQGCVEVKSEPNLSFTIQKNGVELFDGQIFTSDELGALQVDALNPGSYVLYQKNTNSTWNHAYAFTIPFNPQVETYGCTSLIVDEQSDVLAEIIIPMSLQLQKQGERKVDGTFDAMKDYTISIKAKIAGYELHVVPQSDFDLKTMGKNSVKANVSLQEQIFDELILSPEHYYDVGGTITTSGVTAGRWHGWFTFDITLKPK